jgi:hypothetical protein
MPAKKKIIASRDYLGNLKPNQFLETEMVEVEQLGCWFGVRELSVGEKLAIFKEKDSVEEEEQGFNLLTLCLVDENGEQLFEAGDVEFLKQQSQATFDLLVTAALRINGMSDEEVENLQKNSPEGPSESSASA